MDLALLALAVGLGVEPRRMAVLALSLYLPLLMAALLLLVAWLRRKAAVDRAADFCDGIASDLRAGMSLSQSVASAAVAVGAGSLLEGVAHGHRLDALVAAEFPSVGRELAATLAGAAGSGGAAADLFDELSSLAIAHEEIRREVRMAAAPARAAATLFVVTPLLYLGWRWTSGDLTLLLVENQQRIAGVVGLGLLLTGVLGVALVMWRAA